MAKNDIKNKNTGYKPDKPYKDFTKKEKIIAWTTFYRRNPARFIEHYLGLNLYFFQKIMITLMFRFPFVVLLCSRAVSKSYTTSVFAVAYCILYPNSKVLTTSFTKLQANLLITEKVVKELMPRSPNLCREIKGVKTNKESTELMFKNNSSFITSVSGESARG